MGEFRRIAERLAGMILENGTVAIGDLPRIIGETAGRDGDWFNLYPGGTHGKCHDLAVFISLTSNVNTGRGQLSFRDAIEAIIMHMHPDQCPNTRSVVFVTDNWDAWTIKKWRHFLLPIQRDVNFEIYLIVPGTVNEMSL
jgi:hypothetical protein